MKPLEKKGSDYPVSPTTIFLYEQVKQHILYNMCDNPTVDNAHFHIVILSLTGKRRKETKLVANLRVRNHAKHFNMCYLT